MGYPEEEARGALRLSLGRTTTDDEIDTAVEVVPRVVASMRLGTVAVAADPLGQGVPGVSRILVAMSGGVDSSVAAALLHEAGPRGRRRLDAPARRRRHVLRVQEELLLARRRRRRAARGRAARHPVLRHEPRARVRRRGAPAVPRRLPRRPDAVARASTATRTSSSGRCSAGRATCTTARRSRPATTRAATSGRTARHACSGRATPTRTRPTSCTACARTSSSTRGSRWAS